MAHSSPLSRPWSKSFFPLGALVVIVLFFFALREHSGSRTVDSDYKTSPVSTGYSTDDHAAAAALGSSGDNGVGVGHTTKAKTKTIITSVMKSDETTADWIAEFLPDWDATIYVADRSSDEEPLPNSSPFKPHNLPVNQGREAAVYLTYIIQHYYHLPEYMVFIHGKRYQIHNEQGYASLRCNWMHCPGVQVKPELGYEDDFWPITGLYASAYHQFFPSETIPIEVTGPCCAQFAVTRDVVQRWPIDKYEQIRQWMWTLEGIRRA
ncbi:hypothetical protein LTR62_002184 [Meristemomyces frigidus]|uniref:Uncharacterized protein n=1 Tax=Meristemomyces frigidus TaxID=1508187 RepID=A0AAN7TF97_9PEZI|nr:hypothetical protein LTR62_002184 [Meristemomyces frigidus]